MNNNVFLSWFAGFCDAESNFQTTKIKRINKDGKITSIGLKYSFHIGLHERDKPLLEFIQVKLDNKGKIYEYPNKKESHLAIYTNSDLKWIIENVFNNYSLLTKGQLIRYEQFKLGIINNLKRLDSLDDFNKIMVSSDNIKSNINNLSSFYIDNWIVGFLNGEVSFTNTINKNNLVPVIYLEHTDETVIKLIKERFNISSNIFSRTRDTRKTTYILTIKSKTDLKTIVNFLDEMNNLIGYKLIQYKEWKQKFNI